MEIKVGMVSDRGLNPKRPINQDSFLAVPQHGLFAVFDGVGGQKAGEVASRMAAETIEEVNIPGYRLHALSGNLLGYWSIRVTGNWRMVFRFEDGEAHDVDLIDYH